MCYARRVSVLAAAVGGIVWGSSAFGAINASWAAPVSDSWTSPTAWTINPTYPDNGQPNPADLYNAIVNVSTGVAYTISLPTDITISSLLLNSPDATIQQSALLRIVDGGLTINAGKYQMDSGELNTDEAVSIKTRFTWNGGTLSGFGSVEVLSGALFDASSFGSRTLSRVVNNAGVVNLNGASFSGGTINNLAGGVLNLQDNVTGIGTNNLINNAGLISIDSKPNISLSVPLQNSGTISVNNSLLTFSSGTFTHLTGSVITGVGTVNLGSSGVNHILAGNLTLNASTITLNGATLSGAGNLQINSGLTWNSGTMSGSGVTTVTHGAVVNLGPQGGTRGLSRTLNNSGVINISSSNLFINNGTLNNLADGVLNFSGLNGPVTLGSPSTSSVNNAGLINVTPSNFLTLPPLNDSGTINIISGAASFSPSGTNNYESGAIITGAGTIDFSSASHVVNGTLTIANGNARMSSGSFTGIGNINVTNAFAWNGGTIDGAGSMNILPGASLNVGSFGSTRMLSRTINNSGFMNLAQSGSISFGNGTLNNLAGGVMNINSTNPFNNFGGGSNSLVRNSGVMNIDPAAAGTSGGTVRIGGTDSIPFLDSGTINLLSGSLSLGGGTYNAGAWINASGFVDLTTTSSTGQTLNGTLTLFGPNFNMTGGTLSGSGDLAIRGNFNWSGGTISGNGIVDVSATSSLNIASFGTRTLSRTVNVAGVMSVGPGSLTLNSGTINILPGGVMNLLGSTTSPVFSTIGTFTSQVFNQGQINLNGGTSNVVVQNLSSVGFVNAGTINVPSGTLVLGGMVHETGAVINGQGFVDLNGNTSLSITTLNDTLTLNGSNVNMNQGTLAGVGNLAVNGVFNWGGGTLTGLGAVNVAPGAAMNVGTSQSSRGLSRVLNNSGTLNFNNTTPIFLGSGGGINNLPGGVINVTSTSPFSGTGTAVLSNNGLMNFNFGSLSTGTINLPLVDSATINVSSGSLSLGTTTFNTGAFLTGPGFINLNPNFGTQTVNGTVTLAAGTMRLNSGSLDGPGNIVLTSQLNWDGGTISGSGSMDVRTNAVLTVSSFGSTRVLARTLNNSGTINLLGQLNFNGGTINNLAGGVINTGTLSPFFSIASFNGTNRIVNAGAVNISTGSISIGVPFSNTGTVIAGTAPANDNLAGTLQFTGIVQQLVAPTLTRGTWIVHKNSTLSLGLATITNNAAAVTLDGANSLFPNLDTIDTNSGTFSITGGRTFVTSASYTNSGKTVIGPGSTLHIIGTLSSTGTLDVMGSLIVDGMAPADVLSQLESGRGDGSWNGAGITSSAAAANPDTSLGFGQTNTSGAGPLDGQPGTGNSVLILYTLKGDSNLDGAVNALDFNNLATNFGRSDAAWTDSDYDYNGTVNTADFVALAKNFGSSITNIAPSAPYNPLDTLVPEPGTLGLVAGLGLTLCRRRHKKTVGSIAR